MKSTENQKLRMRLWYQKNKSAWKRHVNEYRLKNLVSIKKKKKIYSLKNKTKFNQYLRQRTKTRKEEVYKKLGGKCIKCGFNKLPALEVHHKYKKIRKNDWVTIKNFDLSKVELVCSNCHSLNHYG